MCVEAQVGGCLDYIEALQPSVSYGVTPQCPLDSAREMIKGPSYILRWAEIQLNVLYTPLHSHSLAEIFPSGALWVRRGERNQNYKNTAAVDNSFVISWGLTGGCISEVMISHSSNKLKEFMTLRIELKISW